MTKKLLIAVLSLCLLLILAAGALLCHENLRLTMKEALLYPELPRNPENGKWYSVPVEGAVSADGSRWQGRIRFGDPERLLIYFLGGGMVLDDFSASQSYARADSVVFYYDNDLNVSARRMQEGIASDAKQNPFRDWTVLMLPYTTGDFHAGTAGMHQGCNNFRSLMETVQNRLGTPDQLLIAGYSAGGFGAAMLAEDVLAYFPETENVTLCVDSALLLHPDWRGLMQNRWQAPEHISARLRSDNLTLDQLLSLHQAHPEVKILVASSLRDGGLAKFQSYIDGGSYRTTPEGGLRYFENLSQMLAVMVQKLPDAGIFLWDDAPNGLPTSHTMLHSDVFFEPNGNEASMAEWISDAVDGSVHSCGLRLLQCLQ